MSVRGAILDLVHPLDVHHPRTGGLRAHGAVSLLGLAAQGIIRLLVAVIVGRIGGAAVLGLVAGGMATAQFLILLWPTTSGQAASRFIARARGRGDDAELGHVTRHLCSRVVAAGLVLAAGSVPVSLWRGLEVSDAVCVAVFLMGVAGQQFTRGVHYGVNAVTRVVLLDISFSLFGLLGLAGALLAGARSMVVLLPLAVAYLCLSAACWPRGGRSPVPRALSAEIDRFVAFGSLGTLASAGLVQISVLVASGLGPSAAGHYAAASNLAIPLTLVSGAMSLVLYPSMAEAFGRGDTESVRHQLDRGVRGLVFLMVPAMAVLVALSGPVVRLIYGAGFDAATPVLEILFGAVVVSMVGVPCVNALTSGGRRGIEGVAALSVGALAVAAVLWLVLVPRLGLLAVALGYGAGVCLIALVAVGVCARRWRQPWGRPVVSLVGGLGVIAAGAIWPASGTAKVAAAAAFVLVWLVINPAEARMWLRILRRG